MSSLSFAVVGEEREEEQKHHSLPGTASWCQLHGIIASFITVGRDLQDDQVQPQPLPTVPAELHPNPQAAEGEAKTRISQKPTQKKAFSVFHIFRDISSMVQTVHQTVSKMVTVRPTQ